MARITATAAVRTVGLVCLALLACAATTAAATTIKTKTKVLPISEPPVPTANSTANTTTPFPASNVTNTTTPAPAANNTTTRAPATNKTKTKVIPATLSQSLQERITESQSIEINATTNNGTYPNSTLQSAPLGAVVAPEAAGHEIASPAPSAYPAIPCAFAAILACVGASLV